MQKLTVWPVAACLLIGCATSTVDPNPRDYGQIYAEAWTRIAELSQAIFDKIVEDADYQSGRTGDLLDECQHSLELLKIEMDRRESDYSPEAEAAYRRAKLEFDRQLSELASRITRETGRKFAWNQ